MKLSHILREQKLAWDLHKYYANIYHKRSASNDPNLSNVLTESYGKMAEYYCGKYMAFQEIIDELQEKVS